MPQLSPLNWVFLFLLFWSTILSVSILIWWMKKDSFSLETSEGYSAKDNKWSW